MEEPGGAARRTAAGGKKRGTGALGGLLAGVVLGALGAVFLPDLAGPYLPGALRGDRVEVAGVVEGKSTEAERLLLTVGSESGAMLATFRDEIAEIDLLVSVGDSVLLSVDEYAPFVDDAHISRVMKQRDWRDGPAERPVAAPDTTGSADTAETPAERSDTSEVTEPGDGMEPGDTAGEGDAAEPGDATGDDDVPETETMGADTANPGPAVETSPDPVP
ncbi:MAG: hypothetical protein ACODAA_06575 [Gemmatimonadota bacterium]